MSAALDLHQLKRERGGYLYDNSRKWLGPGPGHSRRDRSLSVSIGEDGRVLIYSFSGDRFADCARYLGIATERARPMTQQERNALVRRNQADADRQEADARAFVSRAWLNAEPVEGSPAEAYLFGRGLVLEGCDDVRFHRAAPRSNDGTKPPHPAMVALVRNVAGEATGLHVTYLTKDGRKAFGPASRLMFGKCSGGAVRLAPIGADGALAVAEGIETAAAFMALRGIPSWAALSTSGLRAFYVPGGVRRLILAADSDDEGAGLAAARSLAGRVQSRCDAEIHAAPEGRDWANVAEAAR